MPKLLHRLISRMVVFLWVGSSFAQVREPTVEQTVSAFRFKVDEYVGVDVAMHLSTEGNPIHYSAYLETDVCSDGLCRPISITISWDLLGGFLSYYTDKRHPLTKFDHIELTAEDHTRLHKILSDTRSILRDYEVEDMIDTTAQVRSHQVDAITRPTSTTFDGTTVEGALYTVYTLWHFINGPIRTQIRQHTLSLMSDTLIRYLLKSGNREYVDFVFKNLTKEQKNNVIDEIFLLLGNSDEYIPHFALAQLEDSMIVLPNYQQQLLTYFPKAQNSLKNALLDRLASVSLDSSALVTLLTFLSHLNLQQSQIHEIFAIIENNRTNIDKEVLEKLQMLSQKEDNATARQAKYTLSKIN